MRQTFRYTMLTLSFALITYGLLAWQQINFSLTALTHFRTAELHPVLALILGLGLLTPTLAELIGAHRIDRETEERYETN